MVVVSGELGAGKTTLIRGACRALGVEGPVTSPTFTIGQRYSGRLPVSHLDLYRLGGLEDEDPALLDDYLDPASVGFVEWPAVAAPRARRPPRRRGRDRASGRRAAANRLAGRIGPQIGVFRRVRPRKPLCSIGSRTQPKEGLAR